MRKVLQVGLGAMLGMLLSAPLLAQVDFPIGSQVQVQMGGGWRPGQVIGKMNGGFIVRASDIYGNTSEMLYSGTMIRSSQGGTASTAPNGNFDIGSSVEVTLGGEWRPGTITGKQAGGYIVKASDLYGNVSEMLYSSTMVRSSGGGAAPMLTRGEEPKPQAPTATAQTAEPKQPTVTPNQPERQQPLVAMGDDLAGLWYYASGESEGSSSAVYGTLRLDANGRYDMAQRISGSLLASKGTWTGTGGVLRLTPDPGRGKVQTYQYYIGTRTDHDGVAFRALTLKSTGLSLVLTKEKRN